MNDVEVFLTLGRMKLDTVKWKGKNRKVFLLDLAVLNGLTLLIIIGVLNWKLLKFQLKIFCSLF